MYFGQLPTLSRTSTTRSPEPAPGLQLDRQHADVPSGGGARPHRIVGRRRRHRRRDFDALPVFAVHEARRATPDRRPEVSVVSSDRYRDETLSRKEGQRARDDSGPDTGAVPAGGVALAGTLLHGDLAVVKRMICHGRLLVGPWLVMDQNVRIE